MSSSEDFCVQVCLMLLTMSSLAFFTVTARTDFGDNEILPGKGFSGSVDN